MKAKVKLNPVRIVIPKYGNAPMLLLEYLHNFRPKFAILVSDKGETFEVELPLTKQSIRPLLNYINDNLPNDKSFRE
jgi:hypothetical protein